MQVDRAICMDTSSVPVRIVEDYAVVYFGAALFKIVRLLVIATFTVHLFACIFYRVKVRAASVSCNYFFLQHYVSTRWLLTPLRYSPDNLRRISRRRDYVLYLQSRQPRCEAALQRSLHIKYSVFCSELSMHLLYFLGCAGPCQPIRKQKPFHYGYLILFT